MSFKKLANLRNAQEDIVLTGRRMNGLKF